MMLSSVSTTESNPVQRQRSKAPVFVLGCPRSGTTLLYHMLLSAGNFAIYRAESQVFNLLEPRFGDLSVPQNKSALLAAWRDSSLFTRTGVSFEEIEREVIAECRNGGDFLRIVMETMARQQNVERWADCTPEHLLYLDRIKQTIPNALVVHIIRDGRDVALSLEKLKWIKPFGWQNEKTLEAAALYWEWIVRKGRESGKRLGTDYMEVQFETLVNSPREVLARVGEFIGQDLDYEQIEKVGVGSVSRPNSSFTAEVSGGDFSPVGRWRSTLSPLQLASLEGLIGSMLKELGYPITQGSHSGESASRAMYLSYFDFKLMLKKKTPLGRLLVTRDLSNL